LILIGGFELHGSKKRLIPSIAQRNVKNAQFSRVYVEFLWDDCGKKILTSSRVLIINSQVEEKLERKSPLQTLTL
jgi:hypothetical protein